MSNGAGENESAYAALLSEELARITGRLRGLGAERIILFGSYAKGRADPGTDLDLIAVMRSELPFVERTGEIYRELAPRVAVDSPGPGTTASSVAKATAVRRARCRIDGRAAFDVRGNMCSQP